MRRSALAPSVAALLLAPTIGAQAPCPPTYWVHGDGGDPTAPVIAFVPAGWESAEQMAKYRCALQRIVTKLLATPPYAESPDRLRVVRVDPWAGSRAAGVPANQPSGCIAPFWNGVCETPEALNPYLAPGGTPVGGLPGLGTLPSFSFSCDASYGHGGIHMTQVEDARKAGSCALSGIGVFPFLVVALANAGGIAGYAYYGDPPVAALTLGNIDANAADPLAHELGHAFSLADESGSVQCAEKRSQCSRANVVATTLCGRRGAPWSACCTSPAPGELDLGGCVLAIDDCQAGNEPSPDVALYRINELDSTGCTDCYRPSFECKMEDLADPYCPVCRTEIRRKLAEEGTSCVPRDCEACVESETITLEFDAAVDRLTWKLARINRADNVPGVPPLPPPPELLRRLHIREAYAEVELGGVLAEVEIGSLRFGGDGVPRETGRRFGIRRGAGFPYDRFDFSGDEPGSETLLKSLPPPVEVTNRDGTMRFRPLRVRIVGYLPSQKD